MKACIFFYSSNGVNSFTLQLLKTYINKQTCPGNLEQISPLALEEMLTSKKL